MKFLKTFVLVLLISTPVIAAPAMRADHNSFAPLVDTLLPTVVNISTTQMVKAPVLPRQLPQEKAKDLERFLKQYPNAPKPYKEREAHSLGSGVIINPEGYVLTNNHVVGNAEDIKVTLHDNRVFEGKVIGRDPKTDIALLKIEAEKPLPFAKFGDSDTARVGDWIIAIGNPFGLGGTVTTGIISATARDIHAGPYDEFLQTDAAINKGNSGGPMFNMAGEVIGINTAIFSPNGINGGNVGIGFAVPSSMLHPIVNDLIKNGVITRAWLGVRIQTVTKDIAESVGLKKPTGALVVSTEAGSPAEKAKLQEGDIILKFDDHKIDKMRSLPRLVAKTDIGKTVPMLVLRNGERLTLQATLEQMKDEMPAKEEAKKRKVATILNMQLTTVDDELRNMYNIPADVNGVLVLNVKNEGKMSKHNIFNLDVITKANYQPVKNVEDFVNALQKAKKQGRKKMLVRVLRQDGRKYFVAVSTSYGE